ncbi:hypothetical protein [Metabacillus niabensis]|uniref:hypothetical protein n=1 Tax=Metabacillus niabensis TaxID=324854 RepID=UPI001CFB85F8|nr:hypothetical protein [Metabacillus niabensis]
MEILKKSIVFIGSFVLLYIVFEVLTGLLQTALYTPDLSSMNNIVSQEAVFGEISIIPFLASLFAATLAYLLSKRVFTTNKK